ncbi:MAG: hypothetical protein AB7G15_16955 [Alphaproteobacteria bacterium]
MVWDAKAEKKSEGLSEWDLGITRGRHRARLDIPLLSAAGLREAVDIMRGLANQLDFELRGRDQSERTAMLTARFEVYQANQRMKKIHDREVIFLRERTERQKKVAGNGGQKTNAEATEHSEYPQQPQHPVS